VNGDWIELTRVINRYINFFIAGEIQNFGKARCTEFEEKVLKAVLTSIESSQRQLVFATQVQFLLMFGAVERLSEVIMSKVQAMVRDADILALFTFGRIFEDINMKTYNLPKEQVSLINEWIQERTAQVYRDLTNKDEKLSVKTRMMLLHNHLRRKFHVDQEEINFMVKEIGDILDHTDLPFPVMVELARILRKADYRASFKAPPNTDITEKLIDQVLKYRDEVHFHVVYHILVLLQFQCVSLQTAKHLDFLQLSLELFNRDCLECTDNGINADFMAMRALSIFCYYKCLNKESVDKIFNLDYLDVFERTLERVRPKFRRPLRAELMRLNRNVAILYPQFGVPWFHEKFCKEHVDRSNLNAYHKGSLFEADVYSTLLSVVGGNKFIKEGSLSKYYHQVDFELWKYRDPIGDAEFYPLTEVLGIQSNKGNVYDPSKYERIGIILYQNYHRSFMAEMTARELEALGYRAVVISESHWKSMALATPQDKTSYLSNVLGLLRETRQEASNGS